jgi:hypothetical protein
MTLESHIAGSEDRLLEGLSFASKNTASYVTRREMATFAPQQSSPIRPSGVRLCRWSLADHQGWCDGSTLRVRMTLVNLGPNPMIPTSISPASLFRRLRILASGSSVLEDVENYHRTHEMMAFLMPPDQIRNRITEEWGNANPTATLHVPGVGQPIPAGESRVVIFQLMSSFLAQGKYIPLNYIPVVIELECGDLDSALTGTALNWQIERPEIISDIVHLDMSLQNSFSKHMLDGKSLPLHYQGVHAMQASIPVGSSLYSFPVVRGFTRLNKIYISFNTAAGNETVNFACPLGGADNIQDNDNFSWYLQCGSERFPSFDVTSLQESFYRLRQMHPGALHLDTYSYGLNRFVTGLSLERVPNGENFTGFNTRSASQLTVHCKNTAAAVMMHLVLIYDNVANLSSAGVEVLD